MADLFAHPWWLLVLALIGVVAIAAVFITLFTGLGDRPDSARLEGDCRVDSMQFLHAVAGTVNAPLARGGTAQLLNNGDEFYPAIYRALEEAKKTINLMVYIWEPGEVSDRMFSLLTRKAEEGVQVRVMVDGLGGHKTHDENIERLRQAGAQWAWFHPPRFGMLTRLHKRNHRRAIIVDGEVGFTGGAAVMDKWLGDGVHGDCWRDCMVEVHGPIAANLQSAFTSLWTHVTGEMLVGEEFYGPAEESDGDDAGLPGEPISWHVGVVSSPSTEAHPMRALFWLSFRAACERIYITNPYFVPDEALLLAVTSACDRGVTVELFVSEEGDQAVVYHAQRSYYEMLLKAGVKIWMYRKPYILHSKSMTIDDEVAIIGSSNMDMRSFTLNL